MKTTLIVLLSLFLSITAGFTAEPPPLGRKEAAQILEHMEWNDVTVIAVMQGMDCKGAVAPIYATVVAIGTKDQNYQKITQTFTYDADEGWFFYEMENVRARIWNKSGYREVRPWKAW